MITKVSDHLSRGPRPENMDELKALGIQEIINLEVGWFEFFHNLEGKEKEQAFSALIGYDHLPISDWMFPTKKEFDSIMNVLIVAAINDEKIYIHCLHGQDRTGIVCAAYRVKVQNWKVDDAINEMYSMGFHKFPYEFLGWVRELREYLNEKA